jgi:alpha-L-rhamnosidase
VLSTITDRARLVRRSWLMEAMGRGDPMGDIQRLFFGTQPEPTWDVEAQVVESQPFFRYVVHDAVVAAGRADLLPELCLDWKQFLDAGETTWPESWHGGSHCHGWSTTPTRDLITSVLGITPGEPGFATARIAPRLGPLSWAKGTAPTPFGWIAVDVQPTTIAIDSPVPVVLCLGDGLMRRLEAGSHTIDR